MTRAEIIKLASQAIDDTRSEVDLPVPFVLRFANLVIADFLAQTGQYVTNDASREAAIKKAVDAERDACAKACDERAEAWRAAHIAGQRAMQERAAAVCDEHAIQAAIFKAAVNEDGGPAFRHCCLDTASGAIDSAAEEIRDLEVKP